LGYTRYKSLPENCEDDGGLEKELAQVATSWEQRGNEGGTGVVTWKEKGGYSQPDHKEGKGRGQKETIDGGKPRD